ncbi:MAG: hypothetical protein KDA58_12565, partial [Planctomycetaceae bacterium]|nr:hypothetical protein [Planctomycetaceae bacterium]
VNSHHGTGSPVSGWVASNALCPLHVGHRERNGSGIIQWTPPTLAAASTNIVGQTPLSATRCSLTKLQPICLHG